MKTEIRPLDGIRENEANPRQMQKDKFAKLVDSLLVFPKMLSIRPIVVDDSGVILGGNFIEEAVSICRKNNIKFYVKNDLRRYSKGIYYLPSEFDQDSYNV